MYKHIPEEERDDYILSEWTHCPDGTIFLLDSNGNEILSQDEVNVDRDNDCDIQDIAESMDKYGWVQD